MEGCSRIVYESRTIDLGRPQTRPLSECMIGKGFFEEANIAEINVPCITSSGIQGWLTGELRWFVLREERAM